MKNFRRHFVGYFFGLFRIKNRTRQLSAVDAVAVGQIILKDHIEHCIVDAVKTGDTTEIERLNKAIEQFIR